MAPLKFFEAPVRETTAANPDALQHSVAGELVHYQGRVQQQGGLVVVGHNASDEVGIGRIEGVEQGFELGPEGRGDSFEDLGASILSLLFLL